MRRVTTWAALCAAIGLFSACRSDDELTITPRGKPGEGTSGKYPDGSLPPAGLISPGDQRAHDPGAPARGLDLRADWATTGAISRGNEHPAATHPFGAQGAEHNGPADVDHRALPAHPPGALTVRPPAGQRE